MAAGTWSRCWSTSRTCLRRPRPSRALCGLHPSGTRTHRTQLGREHGLAPAQTRAIPARLVRLLRHQPVLAADSRTGPMASPACAHVLLETVALGAHEGAASAGAGREPGHRDRKSTRLNSSHQKISYAVFC